MNAMRKVEIGTLVTVVLAMIGFGFYLGGLTSDVNDLKSGTLIRQQTDEAVASVKAAAEQFYTQAPVGTIAAYAGAQSVSGRNNIPEGWLPCDGRELPRESKEHARLFAKIGTSWGSGDGKTTFNLPDLRGLFLRGVNGTAQNDPDVEDRKPGTPGGVKNEVGSKQLDATTRPKTQDKPFQATSETHDHVVVFSNFPDDPGHGAKKGVGGPAVNVVNAWGAGYRFDGPAQPLTISKGGDNETRPKNAYVNFIIRF
jgi:microcystin-dependent protein